MLVVALMAVGCAEDEDNFSYSNPDMEQIEDVYMAYVQDFIDNDFEGIASHFQTPVMRRGNGLVPTRIAMTPDELMDSYRDDKANIQEGYKYSRIDCMYVRTMAVDLYYYLDAQYTRYNDQDEIIFEGRTLYYFSNESGNWKMFATIPAETDPLMCIPPSND